MNNENISCEIAVNRVERELIRINEKKATPDDIRMLISDIEKYKNIAGFTEIMTGKHGPLRALIGSLKDELHRLEQNWEVFNII